MAPVRYRYVSERDIQQQEQRIQQQQERQQRSSQSGRSSPSSSSASLSTSPSQSSLCNSSSSGGNASAISTYASLKRISESTSLPLLLKQQDQHTQNYHALLQRLVLSQWKECVERRKKLAWKVLVALRMRAVIGRTTSGVQGEVVGMEVDRIWEEEGGMLCLVS